jgi:hypothetical protein
MLLLGLSRKAGANVGFDVSRVDMIGVVPPEHNTKQWELDGMTKGSHGPLIGNRMTSIMSCMDQCRHETGMLHANGVSAVGRIGIVWRKGFEIHLVSVDGKVLGSIDGIEDVGIDFWNRHIGEGLSYLSQESFV